MERFIDLLYRFVVRPIEVVKAMLGNEKAARNVKFTDSLVYDVYKIHTISIYPWEKSSKYHVNSAHFHTRFRCYGQFLPHPLMDMKVYAHAEIQSGYYYQLGVF